MNVQFTSHRSHTRTHIKRINRLVLSTALSPRHSMSVKLTVFVVGTRGTYSYHCGLNVTSKNRCVTLKDGHETGHVYSVLIC